MPSQFLISRRRLLKLSAASVLLPFISIVPTGKARADVATAVAIVNVTTKLVGLFQKPKPDPTLSLLNQHTEMLSAISDQINTLASALTIIDQKLDSIAKEISQLDSKVVSTHYATNLTVSTRLLPEINEAFQISQRRAGAGTNTDHYADRLKDEVIRPIAKSRTNFADTKDVVLIPLLCSALHAESNAQILALYPIGDRIVSLKAYIAWLADMVEGNDSFTVRQIAVHRAMRKQIEDGVKGSARPIDACFTVRSNKRLPLGVKIDAPYGRGRFLRTRFAPDNDFMIPDGDLAEGLRRSIDNGLIFDSDNVSSRIKRFKDVEGQFGFDAQVGRLVDGDALTHSIPARPLFDLVTGASSRPCSDKAPEVLWTDDAYKLGQKYEAHLYQMISLSNLVILGREALSFAQKYLAELERV